MTMISDMARRQITFGQKLRQLRKDKNLTQRDLAHKVARGLWAQGRRGFDFTYLSKIENDKTGPPSIQTIQQLAKVLKVSADELITLAGKVPPDFGKTLKESTDTARAFYRSAFDANLTDEDWQDLLEELKRRKQAGEDSSKSGN